MWEEGKTKGAPPRRGTLVLLLLQLLPQSGALCWSLQTLPSHQNGVILCVNEKPGYLRWERERMDGRRRELCVSSSWHYYFESENFLFPSKVLLYGHICFFLKLSHPSHTYFQEKLSDFFFFFLIRVANLPVSSQPPPNKSSCGFFILTLFPPLREGITSV